MAVGAAAGGAIVFGLRPAAFTLVASTANDPSIIETTAVTVESLGDEKNVLFVPPFGAYQPDRTDASDAEPPALWTARIDPDAPVHSGDRIGLRMDLTAAYFFDPHTERAIPAESFAPALAS